MSDLGRGDVVSVPSEFRKQVMGSEANAHLQGLSFTPPLPTPSPAAGLEGPSATSGGSEKFAFPLSLPQFGHWPLLRIILALVINLMIIIYG